MTYDKLYQQMVYFAHAAAKGDRKAGEIFAKLFIFLEGGQQFCVWN